ncbi:WD repeat-containing protein 53 [Tanacetum coccineum]
MAEESVETKPTKAARRLKGHKAMATCCIASTHRPALIASSDEDGRVCWFDMRSKDALYTMDVAQNPISSLCYKQGLILYLSFLIESFGLSFFLACLVASIPFCVFGSISQEFSKAPYLAIRIGITITDLLVKPIESSVSVSQLLIVVSRVSGNEDILYVSSENEVKVFDVHMLASWKPLESYNYNKEEINQISCNSKSSFIAAADDGGDIKIIDIHQKCLYKTLRAAHESICSSVQFLPWRPWEVITGGLDSKLIMWDFSKGRPYKVMDLGKSDPENNSNAPQCFNPAFVHAIAVPEVDMLDKVGKICVVARGDGVVDVINIESEFKAAKSQGSSKSRKGGQAKSTKPENQDPDRRTRLRLDYTSGGHTAAVSCVAFSMFGERGKYIVSGGNDKAVKAWNWSRYFEADQTCDNNELLHLNIHLSRKVNWLCTTPTDSENLVVCDTSKVVKVYTVA